MAFHNVNFQMVPLPVGTYAPGDIGNNITASTIHEVYCISAGSITINALGGGSQIFALTANQSVKVLVGSCTVSSGAFVGFKAQFNSSGISPTQWGGNL